MRLAWYIPPRPSELWTLALQLGVTDAVTQLPQAEPEHYVWDFLSLLRMKQRFADAGLQVAVIESAPVLATWVICSQNRHLQHDLTSLPPCVGQDH